MNPIRLPMGCLPSRATIAPDRVENRGQKGRDMANGTANYANNRQQQANGNSRSTNARQTESPLNDLIKNSENLNSNPQPVNLSLDVQDDDIMSILLNDQEKPTKNREQKMDGGDSNNIVDSIVDDRNGTNEEEIDTETNLPDVNNKDSDETSSKRPAKTGGSFDEEPNLDLLRQYVAVDFEIKQLEDKDALRVYHERIEQLEQLERELDMISSEAEEVAVRSESDNNNNNNNQLERMQYSNEVGENRNDSKMLDGESNSILSGATGSMSHKSWVNNDISGQQQIGSKNNGQQAPKSVKRSPLGVTTADSHRSMASSRARSNNTTAYSTVEEVFNRKILLEKERDKLKKEVESVIVECDKLQQRYKKRDEILDKLFDGRTGNGLENHLEQQLNWLLEQKHYVDQVFYAWKRAETLTSQTCEQFASALELLKRLSKIQDVSQRAELAKSIESLIVKSRQDMEQAQKYNPNVDAPFFTDNETQRFDKIIETISSGSISASDYSQILTVIQFAYKRAVSIRMWLEQILQTTIARDSFELAEEYKWIAIQLRKERINLIKNKLQYPPYQAIAQAVQEQLEQQQQQSLVDKRQHEINRDSGVESEPNDIDIEEEIYRLLEMNKSRLEGSMIGSNSNNNILNGTIATDKLKVNQNLPISSSASSDSTRVNVGKRIKGNEKVYGNSGQIASAVMGINETIAGEQKLGSATSTNTGETTTTNGSLIRSGPIPTKLRIELDEEAKQSLLKQVDQIHTRHKSQIERLRGNNRNKAANSIRGRLLQAQEETPKGSASVDTNQFETSPTNEPAN